jgi:DNA-binding transcriptional ArsR family regulator
MPSRRLSPAVTVTVTPRFEVFYALQALESGSSERLRDWRREMERRLPSEARATIASVGPSALMWPLLADALCDEPAGLSFDEVLSALRRADAKSFQRAVLGGVFTNREAVEALISGKLALKRATANEVAHRKLLELLGLHPFDAESATVDAFERLVSRPSEYRNEVVNALSIFWRAGFADTWEILEPQMRDSARRMRGSVARNGFGSVATEWKLPVTLDKGAIVSGGGANRMSVQSVRDIHLIPSAFNVTRLWASYTDSEKRARIFIPVFDAAISPASSTVAIAQPSRAREKAVDPAAVFKALGDTTRYAIATTLARTPMTSVELARLFKVSKPTISHHVQQLRNAQLLLERQGDNGVVLSLNRRILERTSSLAAAEMFSAEGPDHVVRRSRKKKGHTN